MAEESINLLVAMEKSESNDYSPGNTSQRKLSFPGNVSGILPEDHRISSDSCHDTNNARRNSTGKPRPRSSKEKIVPHYLRASTGSCHDFCKYGRKQAFEEKEIHPWRKRSIKAQSQSNKQTLAVTLPLEERKKATVLKQITSPDRTEKSAMIAPLDESKKATVFKQTTSPGRTQNPGVTAPLDERKNATVLKQMTSPGRTQNPTMTAPSPLDERKKATVLKQMTSPGRTQNPAMTAPLDERKKATVPKQMRSPNRTQNPAMNAPRGERKKAMVLKQMASPDRKSALKHKAPPAAMKSKDHPEIVKQEVLLPSRKVEASSKDSPSHKNTKVEKKMNKISYKRFPSVRPPLMKQLSSFHTLVSAKRAQKAEKTREIVLEKRSPSVVQQPAIPKASSSLRTSEGSNGRGKRRDNITKGKNTVVIKASAKKAVALPTASSAPSIARNIAMKGKKSKGLKLMPSLLDQNSIHKAEMGKPENENVPRKTFHVLVIETENNISESTAEVIPSFAPQSFPSPKSLSQCRCPSLSSQEGGEIEDYDDVDEAEQVGEDENGYTCEEMDELLSDKDEMANNNGIKVEEGNQSEEEVEGEIEDYDDVDEEEEVEEDENGYTCEEMDELLSDKDEMANSNGIKVEEGNQRKTMQKEGVISESKDPTPVKMKFRRGRVVVLQAESNSSPRRLRFRRVRVMDDNQVRKSEIRSRNFKKKGADADADADIDADGNVIDPSNEKVVLRHRGAQGKKDAQGLFNNVIEETASKLVESRKSKVKALVGAFETVISLQDIKPSSQTQSTDCN